MKKIKSLTIIVSCYIIAVSLFIAFALHSQNPVYHPVQIQKTALDSCTINGVHCESCSVSFYAVNSNGVYYLPSGQSTSPNLSVTVIVPDTTRISQFKIIVQDSVLALTSRLQ